jgi:outer membrane immunogenic protein
VVNCTQGIVTLLFAGIGLVGGLQPALTADITLPPVNAPLIGLPFSWTGFYLGGNVGAGFGTTETSADVGPIITAITGTPVAATLSASSQTFNGFLGGFQGGYNWQAGVVVLGVEGDFDFADMQGNAPCVVVLNCNIKHNWVADITGRVGVVAVERALLYLKGGVAWEASKFSAGNTITIGTSPGTISGSASGTGTQIGGLLGMGIEYAFLPNWSAKIEYNFIDYGTRSFNAPISSNAPPLAGVGAIPVSITENEHIIKAD